MMEYRQEQSSIRRSVAVFGTIEAIIVWGILLPWSWLNGFMGGFLPAVPYVIGSLLLLQLGLGWLLRSGKLMQRDTTTLGRIILYSLLMTVTIPPLIIILLIIFHYSKAALPVPTGIPHPHMTVQS